LSTEVGEFLDEMLSLTLFESVILSYAKLGEQSFLPLKSSSVFFYILIYGLNVPTFELFGVFNTVEPKN